MTQNTIELWEPAVSALAMQFTHSDGAHDASHLRRVWRNAQAILASYPEADQLVVMVSCYLHDMINLPKNHVERSSASKRSAQMARTKLAAIGFPLERLDSVAHAIETHSFSAGIAPATIEAKIVQDADRLDALGAVGLARMFYISGRIGRALAHPHDPLASKRSLEDGEFALDHIVVKLAKLPSMMQTQAGRALGEERLARVIKFREEFASEWSGTLGNAAASDHR